MDLWSEYKRTGDPHVRVSRLKPWTFAPMAKYMVYRAGVKIPARSAVSKSTTSSPAAWRR